MAKTEGITFGDLDAVRQEIADYMPAYNIKRVDPLDALENRVGNCFAKASIACGLLVVRHGIEPTIAYSDRLHGTDRPSTILATNAKNMAHITVLAPEVASSGRRVLSLCFGVEGKSGKKVIREDLGDIMDYNEAEILAEVQPQGGVSATGLASELGLYFGAWRTGINRYLHAIERQPVDAERLIEKVTEIFVSDEDLKKAG